MSMMGMGIAQRISRNFHEAVRARGQTYFTKSRVKILMARPGEVRTKVRGTDSYRVRVRLRNNGRLLVSCSCLYFRPHGVPCKHLWATLLACDARDLLPYPPVKPLKLVPVLSSADRELAASQSYPHPDPYQDRDLPAGRDRNPSAGNGNLDLGPGEEIAPPRTGAGIGGYSRGAEGSRSRHGGQGRGGPNPAYGQGYGRGSGSVAPTGSHAHHGNGIGTGRGPGKPSSRHPNGGPGGSTYPPNSSRNRPKPSRGSRGTPTGPYSPNGHGSHARGGPGTSRNGGPGGPRSGFHGAPITPAQAQARAKALKAARNASHKSKRNSSSKRNVLYVLDMPATLDCHQVVIEPVRRQRKPSGDWGPLRPWSPGSVLLGVSRNAGGAAATPRSSSPGSPGKPDRANILAEILDEEDLEIFGLLERYQATPETLVNPAAAPSKSIQARSQGGERSGSGFPGGGRQAKRYVIAPEHQIDLVTRLSQTGRLRIRRTEAEDDPPTLRWDDGPAWKFKLDVRPEPGGRWTWRGMLRRGHERLDMAEPLALLAPDLMILSTGKAARFDHAGVDLWMARLRHEKEITFEGPKQDEKLGQLLSDAEERISPDDLIEGLVLDEVRAEPQPMVTIRTPPQTLGVDRVLAELDFDYEGALIPGHPPGRMAVRTELRRAIRREPEIEKQARATMAELGFEPAQDIRVSPGTWELPPKKVPTVTREMVKLGWRVEAEGKTVRPVGQFQINVTTGIDWFEMVGRVDFGDGHSVPLPELLAAARQGKDTVTLSDGSIGMLPDDWLKQYGVIAELGLGTSDETGGVRFGRAQAGLLDALLAAQPEVQVDEGFEKVRKSLRKFQGITPIKAPRGFQGELRPYQQEGLGWLDYLEGFQFGGILADDMGLGKTIQVLALMQRRRTYNKRKGPSLIIVPRSLVFNWIREAEKFTPRMRVLDYTGTNRHDLRAQFDDHDLIVTTYGTLRSDIVKLSKIEFDYVILDEAQAIKNSESQSAKAARLLKARHRLAMSGTPIENHLGELWSILEFLNPGMLGTSTVFKRLAGGGAAATGLDEQSRGVLARSLRPFILRRTKKEVVQDLPDKTEQILYCTMDPAQREVYDGIRAHYRQALLSKGSGDLNRSKIEVLEALLRLRQAACHPGLISPDHADQPCAKLDMLLPQLSEVIEEGHKALIFSQFTTFLGLVRDRLDEMGVAYEYLDGRTRKRDEKVERFQNNPDLKVFLISLKAGGLGLNLTSADYVYLLDPWWNPAIEAQAIDRSHRIGQTQHVFAYRLICCDTVEQKIVDLQNQKRDLAEAILSGDRSLISDLSRDDLEFLLS